MIKLKSLMNPIIEPLTFSVPLSIAAHSQAEKFSTYQSDPQKAKQVYLNTLAVYAVHTYLQCMEFETDLERSQSWNPVIQTLMDVADLEVKNYGKLECRPVLPGTDFVDVPAEVWSERIGYVAVQFDQSLREATLLGFTKTVSTEKFPLAQLLSLQDLLEHFSQQKVTQSTAKPVKLSQWLEQIFAPGWQAVEEILLPKRVAFRFRYTDHSNKSAADSPDEGISRVKLINFGIEPTSTEVALMVRLLPTTESQIDISVKLSPTGNDTHLPPGLELMVLDHSGIASDASPGEKYSLDWVEI